MRDDDDDDDDHVLMCMCVHLPFGVRRPTCIVVPTHIISHPPLQPNKPTSVDQPSYLPIHPASGGTAHVKQVELAEAKRELGLKAAELQQARNVLYG